MSRFKSFAPGESELQQLLDGNNVEIRKEIKSIPAGVIGLYFDQSLRVRYSLPCKMWRWRGPKLRKSIYAPHKIDDVLFIKEAFVLAEDGTVSYAHRGDSAIKYKSARSMSEEQARLFVKILSARIEVNRDCTGDLEFPHRYEMVFEATPVERPASRGGGGCDQLFYVQIKGQRRVMRRDYDEKVEIVKEWSWPPIHSDVIAAASKGEAIAMLEESYQQRFPQRILRKDMDSKPFLLTCVEIKEGDYTHKKLLQVHSCGECGQEFTILEKYRLESGYYGERYCSKHCRDVAEARYKEEQAELGLVFERDGGGHTPVIYKITSKISGLSYIGQTTQAFTLRWYQHFFQSGYSSTKFHEDIRTSAVTDWTFEVIEVVKERSKINEREQHWINYFGTIANGYNTAVSHKETRDLARYGGGLFAEFESDGEDDGQ